jgi:hypothetical protein
MSIHKETGTVIFVGQTQTIGSKGFEKRSFVIEEENSKGFTEQMAFEFHGDGCVKLNDIREGDRVEVSFVVKSREWKENWYTNCKALYVKREGADQSRPGEAKQEQQTAGAESSDIDEMEDNLPF